MFACSNSLGHKESISSTYREDIDNKKLFTKNTNILNLRFISIVFIFIPYFIRKDVGVNEIKSLENPPV